MSMNSQTINGKNFDTLLTTSLLDKIIPQKNIQYALLALVGSLLLWASAKISVPFYPVPMTMQTFAVFMIGMAYGPKLAAATVCLYLFQGAVGLPVFSGTPEKGIGFAYMLGTTGGYLLGFFLAAIFCGYATQKFAADRSFIKTIITLLIASVLIYVPGLVYLGAIVGFDKPILAWGLLPFIYGDMTKIILASAILPLLWKSKQQ